jgi:hypothetical protein
VRTRWRFQEGADAGWTLTGEAAELIEKAINIETDEDTDSKDADWTNPAPGPVRPAKWAGAQA